MKITDDISVIKGVGEKSIPLYNKLGMNNVDDVLHYFPRDYVYYEKITETPEESLLNLCAIKCRVIKRPLLRTVKKYRIVSASLTDGESLITATWFNMPFLTKSLTPGNEYVLRGVILPEGDHYHMDQPQVYSLSHYEEIEESLQPVYPLTKGLTNNAICKSVHFCVDGLFLNDDPIRQIHFPKSKEELISARGNFVYEEFLLFMLRLRLLKASNEVATNNFDIIPVAEANRVIERLPYRLTHAQERAYNEVLDDICKNHSMSRLVQGDVGCGKTIIALLAVLTVAINGYQCAVMAPTEILATQHFEYFTKVFKENNIDLKISLLTGSLTKSQKKEIYKDIEEGTARIIIGTHALFQEKVIYNNLALVVTDEQHRFGVNQRELLSRKNDDSIPHVLVMSATPIPRTLAIILYGDLDISVIDEVPAKRLPVKNCVVGVDYRQTAYKFMKKEIDLGHQVYVICPLVEESEALETTDVVSYTEKLRTIFPEGIIIECLHGKMKPYLKAQVMDDFAKGNINILVSTTVVEVGVNVPNATVMLIEDADRFGLAQLHQLRGRIGRGDAQSYCIFMSGNKNKNSLKRLETLNKSNDGFFIASEDLKLRGPGDFFGIRQSGDMRFKLADIYTDAEILKRASEDADRILSEDPELMLKKNEGLRIKIEKMSNGEATVATL